jgi:pimeloyl-ACP methyl ester carboxylesterase
MSCCYGVDRSAYEKEAVTLQVCDPALPHPLVRDAELIVRPKARATVIFSHGFKGNKDTVRALRTLFPHYHTLIFDFRAHGKNTQGQCCSFGAHEKYEVKAAVDYIKHHPRLKHLPLFGYGISMGAASLIEAEAAFGRLFDALILDSPFDDIEQVITRGLRPLSCVIAGVDVFKPLRNFLARNMFSRAVDWVLRAIMRIFGGMDSATTPTCLCPVAPIRSLDRITTPALIMSCDSDRQIPVDVIQNIFRHAPLGSQLWIAHGRHHADAFFSNPEEYVQRINRFLEPYQ